MSDQTLLIITTTIGPWIENRVATSGVSPLKLKTPQTREATTDAAHKNARSIQTPRHVIRTGTDVTDPGNCDISVRYIQGNYPVLIGCIGVPPIRGHSGSLDVLNKWKSTPPIVSRNNQKFDASVDVNLANDGDYMSIFSKVIGSELSHSPSTDIYLRFRMDFTSNAVETEEPNLVDLGLLAVNAPDELNTFGTTATRVRRMTDGPH